MSLVPITFVRSKIPSFVTSFGIRLQIKYLSYSSNNKDMEYYKLLKPNLYGTSSRLDVTFWSF